MLTDKHFQNLFRAHNAISNVLSGRTADGLDAIAYKISFTNDANARKAAAHKLRLILCHCHHLLDINDVTPLTVKLLWHLARTGKQTQEEISLFPVLPIIHAIKHAPHLVRESVSLVAILRRHQQHKNRERAKRYQALNSNVPERALLWTDGVYSLEEATDPRHLLHDSLFLGHCVGTLHDKAALTHRGITPSHPDAIHYLQYWLKIKHGESRILTLIRAATPLITLQLHVETKTIINAQGKITPFGLLWPVPETAKAPLLAAVKTLPIRRGGGRLVRSLPFEPINSEPHLVRLTEPNRPRTAPRC